MLKNLYLLMLISLLSSSCNKLFFETPMPLASKVVQEFPRSFTGEYVEIYLSDNTVEGMFRRISEVSDNHYLIESKYVVFLDSINWEKQKMSPIIDVNVNANFLEIVTQDNKFRKEFSDTLSSISMEKEFEIDLKNGFFYDGFFNKGEYESSKRKCQLRKKDGQYYLNIEHFDKYWLLISITQKEDNLLLNSTYFSLQDEDQSRFEVLRDKYNFKQLKGEDDYVVHADNDVMEELLNEDIFDENIWYSIHQPKNNKLKIILGLLMLVGLAFFIRRKLKQ